MKAEYKRDLKKNCLVLEAGEEEEVPEYCIQMLEQNQISGILDVRRSRMNGTLTLSYEITGKQSLYHLYEKRTMNAEEILQVLSGLDEDLQSLQKFLLSPEYVLFDPRFLFTEPGNPAIFLCYAAGMKERAGINMLAEFILKRLNHQDPKAVEIGYQFYEKTQEENFSLAETLKGFLTGENKREEVPFQERYENSYREITSEESGGQKRTREVQDPFFEKEDAAVPVRAKASEDIYGFCPEKETVQRSEEKEEKEFFLLRLFDVVHPAVLLSALLFFAALEAGYYFHYVTLTEAGGIFFLIISIELYANSCWKRKKEKKKEKENSLWIDEEEQQEEEYEKLCRELYARKESEQRESEIEETRCLTETDGHPEMRLSFIKGPRNSAAGDARDNYPEICVGTELIIVGKLPDQCDVVLNLPTVSRIHASLVCREGKFFLRDRNSRNGTFLNGQRLEPQEIREFKEGDRISFADVEYRAASI